jgi:hypothetical protein
MWSELPCRMRVGCLISPTVGHLKP